MGRVRGGAGRVVVVVTADHANVKVHCQSSRSRSSDRCRCPSSHVPGASIGCATGASPLLHGHGSPPRSASSWYAQRLRRSVTAQCRPVDKRCRSRCLFTAAKRPARHRASSPQPQASTRCEKEAGRVLCAPSARGSRSCASEERQRRSRRRATFVSRHGFPPALDHLCKQSSRPGAPYALPQ